MPEPSVSLSTEDRHWLHDKFERLAAEENELASARTTYYAAIGTVLITGLVVSIADLLAQATVLIVVVTFLSALGMLISIVWIVLLHRTNDAKNMWREAAVLLERDHPPLEGRWVVPITLRSREQIQMDLFRPFAAHNERFSPHEPVSWMDRANPDTLTEILPMTFLAIWIGVIGAGWVWFLILR